MVGRFGLRVGQGAAQHVRPEKHVGIGKQQPVATRLIGRTPHGMNLPQPARRQLGNVNNFQATASFRSGRDSIHDFARAIGGTIVYGDDFVIVVIEFQQLGERRPDVFFFIASRNNDADARISVRSRWFPIPFGPRDVGDLGHAKSGIQQA